MFGGGKGNWLTRMAMMAAACLSCDMADARPRPTTMPAQDEVVAVVSVDVRFEPAENKRVTFCLGGGRLLASILARPGSQAAWELRSGKLVVASGHSAADAAGRVQASIDLPDVRARAESTFSVRAGRVGSRRIDILPAAMLGNVRQTLRTRGLGVLDSRGRVQAAFNAQQVAFTELRPQLQNDYFRGGIVILAGFDDANMLADACDKLTGRTREGMCLIVLNPPEGFRSLGLARSDVPGVSHAKVRLAQGAASLVKETDFGLCRIAGVLEADENGEALAWFESAGTGAATRPGRDLAAALALPVGKGMILAATLPQLRDCYADPVGRCMLSEIVLWVLKRSAGPKEHK